MDKNFNKRVKHLYRVVNRLCKFGLNVSITSNGLCFTDDYEKAFSYGRHWAIIEDDILLPKIPNDRALRMIPAFVKDSIGKLTDTKYIEDIYIDGDKLFMRKCVDSEPEIINIGYLFIPVKEHIEHFKMCREIIMESHENAIDVTSDIELAINDIAEHKIDDFSVFQYSKFMIPSLSVKESELKISIKKFDNLTQNIFGLIGGDSSICSGILIHSRDDVTSYHMYLAVLDANSIKKTES